MEWARWKGDRVGLALGVFLCVMDGWMDAIIYLTTLLLSLVLSTSQPGKMQKREGEEYTHAQSFVRHETNRQYHIILESNFSGRR